MKSNHRYALSLSLVLAASACGVAGAATHISTLADQRGLNVTIYNDGSALIHDRRAIVVNAGTNRIEWRDVSANMDATTAVLDALTPQSRVSVLEQNFDYDLLNQNELLHKYVGHRVTVVHPARFAGERETREPATILSVDDGGNVVLQYRDRIETSLQGYIVYPRVPQSLRDRPTLSLDVASDRAGKKDLDLRYLTTGFTWHVDYVGTLSPDQSRLNLEGMVDLTNTSGTSYHNVRLQLVAGTVHNAPNGGLKTIARVAPRGVSDAYSVMAQQEDYFEYHLYTLGRPTTILNQQTKQLMLLGAHDVPVKKTLELNGSDYYYRNEISTIGERIPVQVFVTFENRGGDLGIPLPAGVMRIYQDDSRGLPQFLGSDTIAHTPRNDTVRLHLGDAFDLVARKRQTDFHLVSNCEARSSYAIDLINGKDSAQNVTINEPLPGDWRITAESEAHAKPAAHVATWGIDVPGEGKATLTYTADVTWCRR